MRGRVHFPIFTLAVVIALAVKFTVHEAEQASERVVEAQVTYNSPGDDVIAYDLVDKVKVGLRGKQREIAELNVLTVQVVVDVPEGQFGPVDINLTAANVRTQEDFDVISLVPNRFPIRVEPRGHASVRVVAQLMGEPAAGARHQAAIVRPASARVEGPESRVRQVLELTAPVPLDGHARTFTETVRVVSPDPLVQVVEPTFVEVEVPMEEPELSITFDNLSRPAGQGAEPDGEKPPIQGSTAN